jgi:uncharacterized protein (UPF0548 family)
MIRLSAPSNELLAQVRLAASSARPTYPDDGVFRPFEYEQTVGHGAASFAVGRDVLRQWRMHRGAGVRVEPVPLAVGTDVVLWTRTLGLTLVFACRISEVFDDDRNFGFTYTTLPGHPEQGTETFRLELINDVVQLHIVGESRPALLLNKLSGPVGHRLQKQFTQRYITTMRSAIKDAIT